MNITYFTPQAVCQPIIAASNPSDPKVLLEALFEGISVFFNYTGSAKCLDVEQDNTPDLGTLGWDYQVIRRLQVKIIKFIIIFLYFFNRSLKCS